MKKRLYFFSFLWLLCSVEIAAQPVTFTAQTTSVSCDTPSFFIDVVVDNFVDISSFQFSMHWDSTLLNLTSISDKASGAIIDGPGSMPAADTRVFSFFSFPPLTLANGATLFRMNFTVNGMPGNSSVFFDGMPLSIEVSQNGPPLPPSQYAFANGAVTITDTEAPTISCPSDVTVDTGGPSTTQVGGIPPNAMDNCNIDLIQYTLTGATTGIGTGDVSNSVNFNVGTTTVEYTVQDFGGNTDNCSFDVTVTNTSAPSLLTIYGENTQVNCEDNTVSVDILADNFEDLRGAQFTLNWNPSFLQFVDTSNIAFSSGVSFGTGNTATGELTFSWFGTATTLPNGQVLFTINFNVMGNAGFTIPIAFNNTPTPIQFISTTSFPNAIPMSEYNITNGSVYIFDDIAPTVSCPADLTVTAANGVNAVITNIAPTASDNCGILDTAYTLSGATSASGNGDASGNTFNLGTTNVQYTITDYDGNMTSCSFEVEVTTPGQIEFYIDSVEVSCGETMAMVNFPIENFTDMRGVQFSFQWDTSLLDYAGFSDVVFSGGFNFGVTDVSDGILSFSWFSGTSTSLPDGTSLFKITFNLKNPNAGDISDIVFIDNDPFIPVVIVTDASLPSSLPSSAYSLFDGAVEIIDNNGPTVTCPANMTVNSGGAPSIPVSGIAPVASDDCAIADTTWTLTGSTTGTGSGDASGTSFNVGTTTVTYTVSDEGGNTESCSFTIDVIQEVLDISCPSNVSQNNDTGICGAIVNNIDVIFISNPANAADTTWTLTGATTGSGSGTLSGMTFNVGTTIAEYIVTDIYGQMDTCNFIIDINDTEGPVLSGVPANVTVECDQIPPAPMVTALDNCDGVVNVNFSEVENIISADTALFIRTWQATDNAGNLTSGIQLVMSIDSVAPVIACPSDITAEAVPNLGTCGATVTWTLPNALDNCDPNIVVTCSHTSGSFFPIGVTEITCYVTDNAMNTDSCKFNVIVMDSQVPVLAGCPGDIFIDAGSNCSAMANWVAPTATDNCDASVTVTSSHNPGDMFMAGATIVTYTAEDDEGNTSTCSFTVNVNDNEPPMISCAADVSISTSGGITDPNGFITSSTVISCDTVILTFDPPLGSDNCLGATVAQTSGPASGSFFTVGTHTIEFTITDASGNQTTCSTDIIVSPFSVFNVTATPDTICEGEFVQFEVDTISGASYMWSGPNGFTSDIYNPTIPSATVLDSGNYIVVISDATATCNAELSVALTVHAAPEIVAVIDNLECTDGTTDHQLTAIVGGGNPVGWLWQNPAGDSIGNTQNWFIFNATEAASGVYSVTAYGANGCSTTTSEFANITDMPELPSIINNDCDNFLCVNDVCSLGAIFSGDDIDNFYWTASPASGAGLPADVNQTMISINPSNTGIYTYSFNVESDGCVATANENIVVGFAPEVINDFFELQFNTTLSNFDVIANDTLPAGFTMTIKSDVSNGTLTQNADNSFTYTPDDGYLGLDQFIYEICVSCNNQDICAFGVVTLEVNIDGCLIPTVLTPNGDGFNDDWIISCSADNPRNELYVYNRWGDEVYSAAPYNNDWNGTYNGQKLPDGTYFYIFKKDATDTDPQRGALTIMR